MGGRIFFFFIAKILFLQVRARLRDMFVVRGARVIDEDGNSRARLERGVGQ